MNSKVTLGSFSPYNRISGYMRRALPGKLPRYVQILKQANAESDSQEDQSKSRKDVVVEVPGVVQNWNWKNFKDLVLLDMKYKDAKFLFKPVDGLRVPKVNSRVALDRLLNNQISEHYVSDEASKNDDYIKRFPAEDTQIYYLQTVIGESSGTEVEKPKDTQVPFESAIGPLKFNISSIVIFQNTKALGITENHPNFQELIETKVNLPIIGEVPFIKVDKEQLELEDDEIITAITPSYVLSHQVYFPNAKPAEVNKFRNFMNNDKVDAHTLGALIAREFGLENVELYTVPYIVSKHFAKKRTPLTGVHQGKERFLPYYETQERIGQGPLEKASDNPNLWFTNITQAGWRRVEHQRSGTAQYNIENLTYIQLAKLLHEGKTLNKMNNKKEQLMHYDKFSTDMFRGLILSQKDISDVEIDAEFQVIDLLSNVLNYHLITNKSRLNDGIDGFHPRVSDIYEGDKALLLKPWDRVIIDRFYKIENKKDVDDFIKKFAIYQMMVHSEGDSDKNRWKFVFEITSNLLIRFLNDHGKAYYPSISDYFLKALGYTKEYKTKNILPGETTNSWTNYIEYPIESVGNTALNDELFSVAEHIFSVVRIGPFYKTDKVILTDNKIILENKALLESINPEGELIFNELDKDFKMNYFIDKICEIQPQHKSNDRQEPRSKSNSQIIFYRNYFRGDVLSEFIFKKLNYLKFRVSPEIKTDYLRKDLLVKLLTDLKRNLSTREADQVNYPLTRIERDRLYSFLKFFVDNLPEKFFSHPLILRITPDKFNKTDTDAKYASMSNRISGALENYERSEARLDDIIMDFLQRHNQK